MVVSRVEHKQHFNEMGFLKSDSQWAHSVIPVPNVWGWGVGGDIEGSTCFWETIWQKAVRDSDIAIFVNNVQKSNSPPTHQACFLSS